MSKLSNSCDVSWAGASWDLLLEQQILSKMWKKLGEWVWVETLNTMWLSQCHNKSKRQDAKPPQIQGYWTRMGTGLRQTPEVGRGLGECSQRVMGYLLFALICCCIWKKARQYKDMEPKQMSKWLPVHQGIFSKCWLWPPKPVRSWGMALKKFVSLIPNPLKSESLGLWVMG